MVYELFTEKYINDNKEYFFLLDGRLPLAPNMWKKIAKMKKVPLAYHVTDFNGAQTIEKLQGSKKQISCFTVGVRGLAGGVETAGGVLIELSGEATLISKMDAFTSLDRSGYRWWDLKWSESSFEAVKLKKQLQTIAFDEFEKIVEKSNYNIDDYSGFRVTQKVNRYINVIEGAFTKNEKRDFIKNSLNRIRKEVKVDFDKLQELIYQSYKGDFQIGHKEINSNFNELVLNDFTVLNKYLITPYTKDSDDWSEYNAELKMFGNEYAGYVTADDIAHISNNEVSAEQF